MFHSTKDTFGGLSNMAPGYGFWINGVYVRTSEALYQACRFPLLPDVQRLIVEESSPLVAKRKSKPYRAQTRSDWDSVRHKIMRWSLRVKLAQNYAEFGELLLRTGERQIVEQSSKDDYWGAYIREGGILVGQNVLGRLLMELREHLRLDIYEALKVVQPLPLPEFLLFGKEIEVVDGNLQAATRLENRLI